MSSISSAQLLRMNDMKIWRIYVLQEGIYFSWFQEKNCVKYRFWLEGVQNHDSAAKHSRVFSIAIADS